MSVRKFLNFFITAVFIVTASHSGNADSIHDRLYKDLTEIFSSGNEDKFESKAFSFLKKYPESSKVPDVRMMLAEIESDTDLAADRYRAVVKYYPYYNRRALALFNLCQILDLKSKWKELEVESYQGIKLFSNSRYGIEFRLIHITSLIMLENYSRAKNEALLITEKTHDFDTLSRAIFLLSEIDRKTTGNSRSYIYSLRELAAGFSKSGLYPSTLYRLAEFYNDKKDYNRAFSAYSDIIKLFPDSPEADMSILKIEKFKNKNPEKVDYIPDMEMVNNSDKLDISPEYNVEETRALIYFSVSIGPFTRKSDTDRMYRLLKNYPSLRTVKARSGYFIYIGKFTDTNRAFQNRIRLAEEYGINGNIVRFSEQGNRSYIYGN
ncbi:MAG TPA: hypothetical protein PK358_05115 [Spirochaetota bacterium]|nr:hypothetical protein [Spirochaetota bacterium]HPJ34194.1 hypothetical protein [Spirochaetota bacterium]